MVVVKTTSYYDVSFSRVPGYHRGGAVGATRGAHHAPSPRKTTNHRARDVPGSPLGVTEGAAGRCETRDFSVCRRPYFYPFRRRRVTLLAAGRVARGTCRWKSDHRFARVCVRRGWIRFLLPGHPRARAEDVAPPCEVRGLVEARRFHRTSWVPEWASRGRFRDQHARFGRCVHAERAPGCGPPRPPFSSSCGSPRNSR